jgi:hypothetical protein
MGLYVMSLEVSGLPKRKKRTLYTDFRTNSRLIRDTHAWCFFFILLLRGDISFRYLKQFFLVVNPTTMRSRPIE